MQKEQRMTRRELKDIRRQSSINSNENIIDNSILNELVNSVKNNTKVMGDFISKLAMLQPKEIIDKMIVIDDKKESNDNMIDDNDDSSDEEQKRNEKNKNERRNVITQSLPKATDDNNFFAINDWPIKEVEIKDNDDDKKVLRKSQNIKHSKR